MKVVLAGGGSAGHVSPLLALADWLVAEDPSTRVTALGTADGIESRLVPLRGYELRPIPKVPLPRRPSLAVARLPGELTRAIRAASAVIADVQADVVVGFGGYVSAPAYLAARRRRVPIVVHEQNSRPGFANRLGARLTPWVAATFPDTPLRHAVRTGLPLRPEISGLDREAVRGSARAAFGLDADRTTLLIFGGSLGAQRLNDVVPEIRDDLAAIGVQVLHICGTGKSFDVDRAPGGPAYVVTEYVDRMELAYAAADLVLGRAGANTVSEITALGLPCVFVPLPIGNGEQRLNAAPVVAAGGGLVIDDAEFDADRARSELLPLLSDPQRLVQMGKVAAEFGRLDAAELLAAMVRQAVAAR
ncbi:MAG TPA: undecaprenyldiphospho-muramoylpentapeptide beta-N-acetylglucosaminyltransferase [Mycobacteriales bacterium]|nr:undecaprenyldiphospho-muramoylpentapeptide beta-N-acetylglucosaminyltransferase [Mycobacteriales bacterium]